MSDHSPGQRKIHHLFKQKGSYDDWSWLLSFQVIVTADRGPSTTDLGHRPLSCRTVRVGKTAHTRLTWARDYRAGHVPCINSANPPFQSSSLSCHTPAPSSWLNAWKPVSTFVLVFAHPCDFVCAFASSLISHGLRRVLCLHCRRSISSASIHTRTTSSYSRLNGFPSEQK